MNAKSLGLSVVLLALVFVADVFVGTRHGADGIAELEKRLADTQSANTRLEAENRNALGTIGSLHERIARDDDRKRDAQRVLGEIGGGIDGAEGTIDRALGRLERIEQAVSILLDGR
jgi:hypothetical protein